MEATGIYWEVVHTALERANIGPLLVHAQHVKQLKGRKTDVTDSVWLARICQFSLCKPSMVPPAEFRALRKVSRLRRQVVRERSRSRNRIHRILDAAGVRIVLTELFGANGTRLLEGLIDGIPRQALLSSLSPHVRRHLERLGDALSAPVDAYPRFLLHDHLNAVRGATRRVDEYDRVIHDGLTGYRDRIDLLMTIPGIHLCPAMAIPVEIGSDIEVFSSRRHFAAWAGLCPGNDAMPPARGVYSGPHRRQGTHQHGGPLVHRRARRPRHPQLADVGGLAGPMARRSGPAPEGGEASLPR